MPRKKKVEKKVEETPVEEKVEVLEKPASNEVTEVTAESILEAPATEPVKLVLAPKVYEIPSTKEDYLALHKCLKDLGVNSIGDLEVRASRL